MAHVNQTYIVARYFEVFSTQKRSWFKVDRDSMIGSKSNSEFYFPQIRNIEGHFPKELIVSRHVAWYILTRYSQFSQTFNTNGIGGVRWLIRDGTKLQFVKYERSKGDWLPTPLPEE